VKLYSTDGTTTTRVKHINLDTHAFTSLFALTPSGNILYFVARNTLTWIGRRPTPLAEV